MLLSGVDRCQCWPFYTSVIKLMRLSLLPIALNVPFYRNKRKRESAGSETAGPSCRLRLSFVPSMPRAGSGAVSK